jgi:hypothetical protein
MRTALQLQSRVERLEAAAAEASTPSVGVQVALILDGKATGPRLSDEELGRTKMGRLLLARRQRAEIGYRD